MAALLSDRVARRVLEFVFATGFVGIVIALLTPMRQRWEWGLAVASLIVLFVSGRAVMRLAKSGNSAARLNRPDRKL